MSEKQDLQDLAERQKSLKLQFIHNELDLAITFCQVAGTTENRETADRNTGNARRACEVITHELSTGTALRVADREEVEGKLTRVQGMLAHLERGEGTGKKADGSR